MIHEPHQLVLPHTTQQNHIKDNCTGKTSKCLTSDPKHTQPHSTQLQTAEKRLQMEALPVYCGDMSKLQREICSNCYKSLMEFQLAAILRWF